MTVYIAYLAGDLNTKHKLAKANLLVGACNALPALIAAVEALKEISKGEGEFDMDSFEHAKNCIHDMKAITRAALAPFGE